jgi:diaminopimelate epimerase
MKVLFSKYQGTGNDFVMLDNFDGRYSQLSLEAIQFMCDRKRGIGADGLILLNTSNSADFEVDYYNADGSKSFCGNGARCAVAFAHRLRKIGEFTRFDAIDGIHTSELKEGIVRLEMLDVQEIKHLGDDYLIDTGSPHFIRFVEQPGELDIVSFGRRIRYSDPFREEGVNVNLLCEQEEGLFVATYERGVEDETLSCGTGVTACALAYMDRHGLQEEAIKIETLGGHLKIEAQRNPEGGYCNIWLSGPAQFVFDGTIELSF